MNEIGLGLAWIYRTLSGDTEAVSLSPGGFWRAMAPPGTATPFVMFAHQGGNDVRTMNAVRLLSEPIFQIRAVGPAAQMDAVVALANRIDALFGGPTSGTVPGGLIDACYRELPIMLDEMRNTQLWTNIGGLYHLEIQRTS